MGDTLHVGDTIGHGQFLSNGRFRLTLQSNGVLSLSESGREVTAMAQREDGLVTQIIEMTAGGLVAYDAAGTVLWEVPSRAPVSYVKLEGDGDIAMYDARGEVITAQHSGRFRTVGAELRVGESLTRGESITRGGFEFALARDGVLVLRKGIDTLWVSPPDIVPATRATLQFNGRFTAHGDEGENWSFGPGSRDIDRLTFRDDGELVILSRTGRQLWSLRTGTGSTAPIDIGRKLDRGESMHIGEQLRKGVCTVTLHENGNLVWRMGTQFLRESFTGEYGFERLSMNFNGSASLDTADDMFFDLSETAGSAATRLSLHRDGRLVPTSDIGTAISDDIRGFTPYDLGYSFLPVGDGLTHGRYLKNGTTTLTFGPDGNLTLHHGSSISWNTETAGTGADIVLLDDSGNLRLSSSGGDVWQTYTVGYRIDALEINSSGTAELRSENSVLWSSAHGRLVSEFHLVGHYLPRDAGLRCGDYLSNGNYTLTFRSDGALELRSSEADNATGWVRNAGCGAVRATLQGDGNFVGYDARGRPMWATGTNGVAVSWLVLYAEGTVALVNSAEQQVWSIEPSRTPPVQRPPVEQSPAVAGVVQEPAQAGVFATMLEPYHQEAMAQAEEFRAEMISRGTEIIGEVVRTGFQTLGDFLNE